MNQIRRIAPISDADAARLVSDAAMADLADQIAMTPAGPSAPSRTRPARRRWWLTAIPAAVAAAALIAVVVAVHPEAPGAPGGTGQVRTDMHALAFIRAGRYIDVIVRNPLADEASYNAEFKAHGLDITLSLVPVSPSLVGTVVEMSGPSSDLSSIKTITAQGRCWTGGGGSECPVGVRVPIGFRGQASLVFGRAARPGEQYESTTSATAPGEVMHGMNYVGKRVSTVLAMLARRHVTVPTYRGPGKALTPAQVPGTWFVYDAIPWAPQQVVLFVGPSRPHTSIPQPALSPSG